VEQITRGGARGVAVRVGVDLAKRVIQVQGVDGAGNVLTNRPLTRDKFIAWCAQLPEGCIVAMETSSSAHHWARKLTALGLDARIIAAQLVSPYRRQGASGKNDANDAAAICEAAGRPQMHFVPMKSIEQQSMLCVHRLREGFKADRTACINRIRGLLAEFGLVFAKSPAALEPVLGDVLEDASNEMNTLARLVLQRAQGQWRELDTHIAWCDERIAAHAKDNDAVKKAATLIGVGPVGASAAVATVGEFKQFKNGAQFGAWIGLVPQATFQRRQEQPRWHHQARRHLPAQLADPRREVSGDERAQALRPDLAMGGSSQGACGLAESRRGPGQQERAHSLGGDDQRRGLRCAPCQRQARCAGARYRLSVQRSITQQAMSQKTQATGQTGSGQARLTLGDSNVREPRDWNGAPLSGSHLGPHDKATAPVQQGRL
jgi:transposase